MCPSGRFKLAMLALAGRYTSFVFFTLSAVVNEKQFKTIQNNPKGTTGRPSALKKVKSADNC